MARKRKLTTLGEARRGGGEPLDKIVGMIEGDGVVTGENFHDYLYGKEDAPSRPAEAPTGKAQARSRSRETAQKP